MKITIKFTLNLDPDAWALDQNLDPKDHPAIREDLKAWAEARVMDELQHRGMLKQTIYSSQGTQPQLSREDSWGDFYSCHSCGKKLHIREFPGGSTTCRSCAAKHQAARIQAAGRGSI